ncbi:MAG: hypothetical protein HBSAPP02_21030 [Phycisphaerae bacterium]|nr:MAG: hypothetical protein HBSAPP02_21030 [Phycisphaerae bacterium]
MLHFDAVVLKQVIDIGKLPRRAQQFHGLEIHPVNKEKHNGGGRSANRRSEVQMDFALGVATRPEQRAPEQRPDAGHVHRT